ncbi:kinase-like domain-containing protein [Mycena vulgaris]|nr:kinase-like domain-containing protein [Mycena vulgaris]
MCFVGRLRYINSSGTTRQLYDILRRIPRTALTLSFILPETSTTPCGQEFMADLNTVVSSDLKILKNFYSYTRSITAMQQRSSILDEFRDLVKQWEGWDILTSLANYRAVVGILFGFLKDTGPPGNGHVIAKEISEILSQDAAAAVEQLAFILQDSETYKTFLGCRGESAQQLLDLIQELLDLFPHSTFRPLLYKALLRLSRASELHPACYALPGLQPVGRQVAAGGFGDIWKSVVRGQTVSIKMMRLFRDADIRAVLKEFGREALIWRQFSHPNLLPFYGLFYVEERLCLVSPWMENGHILQFLSSAPADTNRVHLILDVALGLQYLHGEHVVHGDLKGMNVLVTPSGKACIADFGVSSIADAITLRFTHSTTNARGGTSRYQAPELLLGESSNYFGSDVYAFACVGYEILTGKVPFFEWPNDMAVSMKVIAGQRPLRPESAPDALWMLLQDCWHQTSVNRPAITQIVQRLVGPQIGAETAQTATDWDETFSSKFRRTLQDSPLLPSVTGIERRMFGDGAYILLWPVSEVDYRYVQKLSKVTKCIHTTV